MTLLPDGTTAFANARTAATAPLQPINAFAQLKTQVEPLLVPGLFGSGPDHWQTQWEHAYALPRLNQRDWAHPTPQEWEEALGTALSAARRPVLLLAHSLGAVLASRWLLRHGGEGIAGAFLVAPADVDEATHPEAPRTRRFCPILTGPLPVPSIVVASSNDPWLTQNRAIRLATAWQADYVDGGALGHIGSNEPLGLWPQGTATLFDFARTRLGLQMG